ncbi:hypothetical protein Q7P36_009844 [Cladosporium allicinum]
MPFFNKKPQAADANTATAVGNNNNAPGTEKSGLKGLMSRRNREPAQPTQEQAAYGHDNLNRRPTFGQWLKGTIVDIITMVIMGVIGLGVYYAPPAPSRSFPVAFANGNVVYPQFAYPLRKEIIPIWAAAMLAALVPIVIILLMQIRIRSFWDVNNAVLGLLYSLITAAVFQVMLKCLIGGLRPHFLAVCDPAVPPSAPKPATAGQTSCHSTAAFAGFIYLSLYLNAKLKIFANYHPSYWKLIALWAPVLAATLIAGALTIDEYHNWYDVVAGAIIGTAMALSAYRMLYASVWDFRFNHVPVARNLAFGLGGGAHEGHVFGGAPFDAVLPTSGNLGVAPVAGSTGFGSGAGTNDAGRGRRFGARRARSEEGGAGSHAQSSAQGGADSTTTRRQVGGGMFRKGDDVV